MVVGGGGGQSSIRISMKMPSEFRNVSISIAFFGGVLMGMPKVLLMLAYNNDLSKMLVEEVQNPTYVFYDLVVLSHVVVCFILGRCGARLCLIFSIGFTMFLAGLFIYWVTADYLVLFGVGAACVLALANSIRIYKICSKPSG